MAARVVSLRNVVVDSILGVVVAGGCRRVTSGISKSYTLGFQSGVFGIGSEGSPGIEGLASQSSPSESLSGLQSSPIIFRMRYQLPSRTPQSSSGSKDRLAVAVRKKLQ